MTHSRRHRAWVEIVAHHAAADQTADFAAFAS